MHIIQILSLKNFIILKIYWELRPIQQSIYLLKILSANSVHMYLAYMFLLNRTLQ